MKTISLVLLLISLPFQVEAQRDLPEAQTTSKIIASGAKLISGDKIQQLLVGNTGYTTFLATVFGQPRGTTGPQYFVDERRRIVNTPNGRVERLWWIEGDAFCSQAMDLRTHNCNLFYDLNSTIFWCHRDHHNCNFIMRIVPGNPARL